MTGILSDIASIVGILHPSTEFFKKAWEVIYS